MFGLGPISGTPICARVVAYATLVATLGNLTVASTDAASEHATFAKTLGAVTVSSTAAARAAATFSKTLGVLTCASAAVVTNVTGSAACVTVAGVATTTIGWAFTSVTSVTIAVEVCNE